MDVGIVGLPGSGRTTVFRALLAHRATSASAHGPAVGVIRVADPRLWTLAERFKPKKTTPIELFLHDCCPSLESSFPTLELEALKRMDTLLLVVPNFAGESGEACVAAFDRLIAELILADLAAVEARLSRAAKEPLAATPRSALEKAAAALEAETPARAADLAESERKALRGYALITDRPLIALQNVGEECAGEPPHPALAARAKDRGMPLVALAARLEGEMAELSENERPGFLAEFGIAEAAGGAVTREILAAADIIPFFTVSEDECRAWPVPRGSTAREAAGRIHSDLERGFIRAEVIPYDAFEPLKDGLAEAKRRGLLRVEGKDYVVADGDIVHVRFNV